MLSRKEVARWLGFAVTTLAKWACMPDKNGLPFVKGPSRTSQVRYRREDVEKWIKDRFRQGQ